MSKFEDRAFRVGKRRSGLAEMKGQLVRLRQDLEQIAARNPAGAVVAPLRQRIRALEAEIAEAEAERARSRPPSRDEADAGDEGGPRGGVRSTAGRFPPRGRPG
ncbi:Gas vesicle protein V [Azospirillum halopraeferens]|uniref:Gas vesicle protein V n=1 Tax=Azospirillum halopraeferens TaxID=34010 RepID=UPI0004199112